MEHFIKQTPLFSEECSSIIIRQKRVILSQFSTTSAAEDDIAPSFLETIYGVNVIGAIRKLFSYWFSLKWEENGVFWRLLMLTFFFFSPLFSASLPFSLSSFIVNRNRFQNTEFFNVFRFKNSDPCKGSQKNPQAICYFKSVISEYSN